MLRNGGGYAEEIVLDAAAVVPIPDAMDFVTAAAFPVAYGTSHFALPSRPGELHPEHRVTGGGRPPPVPTERSVQISRTTLFRR